MICQSKNAQVSAGFMAAHARLQVHYPGARKRAIHSAPSSIGRGWVQARSFPSGTETLSRMAGVRPAQRGVVAAMGVNFAVKCRR